MKVIGQTWDTIAKQWDDVDNSAHVVWREGDVFIELNENWLYHTKGAKRILLEQGKMTYSIDLVKDEEKP
jgi:hypothetical protein